jgi:signal transduction histidine kinase
VRRRIPLDPSVAALLLAASLEDVWTSRLVPAQTKWPLTLAVILMTVPLAWRRSYPLTMLCVVTVGVALKGYEVGLDAPPDVPLFAWVIAVYSVAAHATSRRGLVGGAVAMSGAVAWGGFVLGPAIGAGAWAAGRYVRQNRLRADTAERDRDAEAERAVQRERARIARELHDVVSHAMSTIIVQAGAERVALAAGRNSTPQTLADIERIGRQAMIEMRRLLGVLRDGEVELSLAPQPGLGQLDALVESMHASGLEVAVSVHGRPVPLAPGLDVSAYRIVQEALTNVLRHAGDTTATVEIRYRPDEVDIEISDRGRGGDPSPGGNGLIGMRERAALLGGRLEAGPRADGGFAVAARIPLEGA